MLTDNILELIGQTPLLHLAGERIFAKCEFLNPGGSIKDRAALAMIEGAEKAGRLRQGSIIVEPSSGNTGIGLALVGRRKGYCVRVVMPEGLSQERYRLIRALDAEVVLTPQKDGVAGAVAKAAELAAADPDVYVPCQFENPDNPDIHYRTTGPEIWKDISGQVDCFVSGIGSGGTLQGIGLFLRQRRPEVKIIAVEPKGISALLGHGAGPHQIQGIGDGFVPAVLDPGLVDAVVEVSDEQAIDTARRLASENGLLVGVSSGANVFAARQLAQSIPGNIVTILPDRAERYFSVGLL